MAEDKHSKKHPATDKKKRDLKKKGQTPKSQDVPMALGLIAAFGALSSMKGFYLKHFSEMPRRYFSAIEDVRKPAAPGDISGIDVHGLVMQVLADVAMLSAPVLFAVLVMAVVANVGQTGLILTGDQLKPDLKKINPMTKLKSWFSIKAVQDLLKSLAKILLASFLGYTVWKGFTEQIATAVALDDATAIMALGATIIGKLFLFIIILYVVVAAVDFVFQRKNFANDNKMTDKEVKDEYKNSEGDPYQKAKRRQMAQQISMQGPQDHVPQGDVVVINPTELAVVLKYDPDLSPVPFVIAKGDVRLADEIRAAARDHGIPVVRNKPLARALFELCEIGDIVPEDLYRPVAEVLAYVFALREQLQGDAGEAAASAAAAVASNTDDVAVGADGVHDLAGVGVPVIQAPADPSHSPVGAGMLLHDPCAAPVARDPYAAPATPNPYAIAQPPAAPMHYDPVAAASEGRYDWMLPAPLADHQAVPQLPEESWVAPADYGAGAAYDPGT